MSQSRHTSTKDLDHLLISSWFYPGSQQTYSKVSSGFGVPSSLSIDLPVDELGVVVSLLTGPLEFLHPSLISDVVADPIEHTDVLYMSTELHTRPENLAHIQNSDLSLEKLSDVQPSLIGGVEGAIECDSDGSRTAREMADRLVDAKLLPDIGQVEVGTDLVTVGQLFGLRRTECASSRLGVTETVRQFFSGARLGDIVSVCHQHSVDASVMLQGTYGLTPALKKVPSRVSWQ
jgi:hypothetical protein